MSSTSSSTLQVLCAAQQHHVKMASMADHKASVLLGASLIALAVSLPYAHHGEGGDVLIALAITALGTAIAAILALTPRMLVLTEADSKPEVNLLFCGHFTSMDEGEYVTKLSEVLNNEQAAQDALARDLFQMGLVLHQKKFRHLATAYTICVFGLVATGLVWALAAMHVI